MHLGIVDDDTRLIENLRFLLQSEPGVQSVHTFASAEEFLAAQPRPELDILLVDMNLPGLSGGRRAIPTTRATGGLISFTPGG